MGDFKDDVVWLSSAVEASQGRVNVDCLARATAVLDRVDHRLSIAGDATVVAIAGPTGAGKSTLLNALTRTSLAKPGVRRPMTTTTRAVAFGRADVTQLLDWLGVTVRDVIDPQGLDGIVLLDLPDFDSVAVSHREEVDRLVSVADEFLWVVDPQKYADAVLHTQYLRHLSGHGEVMSFVLNQIDRLPAQQVKDVREDLVRLLRDDGLRSPRVFEVSALQGDGVDRLRMHLLELAATKRSMVGRLEADVQAQARSLRLEVTGVTVELLGQPHLAALTTAGVEAMGVDGIAEAVRGSVKRRGRLATGWPVSSWISRLKPDPLKRLGLSHITAGGKEERSETLRSSIIVDAGARARIDSAVRETVFVTQSRLPHGWRAPLDHDVAQRVHHLPDELDQAVVRTDLGVGATHHWWSVLRAIQWLILTVVGVGVLWLVVDWVMTSVLGVTVWPTVVVSGVRLSTLLVIGGVVLGLVVAGLARVAVNAQARVTAQLARRRLRKAVETVMDNNVICVVNGEVARFRRVQDALSRIIG